MTKTTPITDIFSKSPTLMMSTPRLKNELELIGIYKDLGVKFIAKNMNEKGVACLEYAAMIADDGNNDAEYEAITDMLDDYYEALGINASPDYDSHITSPAP